MKWQVLVIYRDGQQGYEYFPSRAAAEIWANFMENQYPSNIKEIQIKRVLYMNDERHLQK